MAGFSPWHWAVVLLVIVLVFSTRRRGDPTATPRHAAKHPVFSSVTTDGDEAEHLNQRLPGRGWRAALMLAALIAVAMIAGWLARA